MSSDDSEGLSNWSNVTRLETFWRLIHTQVTRTRGLSPSTRVPPLDGKRLTQSEMAMSFSECWAYECRAGLSKWTLESAQGRQGSSPQVDALGVADRQGVSAKCRRTQEPPRYEALGCWGGVETQTLGERKC